MVEGNMSRVEATASRANLLPQGLIFLCSVFFQFLLCFLGKRQAPDMQKFSFY